MQSQSSSSVANAVSDSGTPLIVPYDYQPKPIVQESGPVLYKNGQPANKQPKSAKPSKPVIVATVPAKVENEALYTQDSQDAVFEPHSKSIEGPKEDTSNSMDFLDSPKIDKISDEEPKSKPPKVLKGKVGSRC